MPLPDEFIVYGSEEMLKPLIMQLLAQHYALQDLNVDAQSGGNTRPLPYFVKGKIIISIHFEGIITGTIANHKVNKSFRLINDDPATITQFRIAEIARKVHTKFFGNQIHFTTGRDAFCYNVPEQGFNRVWGFFLSTSDAKRCFEQLLDIPGLSPDWKRFTRSSVVEPGNRFQDPPEKVMQFGQLIRTARERPMAPMKFKRATIKFPHFRRAIDLVKTNGAYLTGITVIDDNNDIKGVY